MRQQSKKTVQVRDVVIGGEKPLICLPLVARDIAGLLEEARDLIALQPDLLEWRVDAFGPLRKDPCLEALLALRQAIGDTPLIFTCRVDSEGGMQSLSQSARLEIINGAIASGAADLIDLELSNEPEFLASARQTASTTTSKLIFSYHNFSATPDEQFLIDKLQEGQDKGADISKLAVMPKNYTDVLTVLNATNTARATVVNIPLVTMAMGAIGAVTRITGGLFGSDITFAIGRQSSAPGQIPIADLRAGMALLYPA
ncbi:MAG: type I 3-dehydroquinate dehydratase [Desulfopila sp.]